MVRTGAGQARRTTSMHR